MLEASGMCVYVCINLYVHVLMDGLMDALIHGWMCDSLVNFPGTLAR
jgi:hypothetical protein